MIQKDSILAVEVKAVPSLMYRRLNFLTEVPELIAILHAKH